MRVRFHASQRQSKTISRQETQHAKRPLGTLISDAETKNDLVKYIVSKLAINRTANISIIVRLTNKITELQNLKYYSFATASSSFLSVTKVSKTNQGI